MLGQEPLHRASTEELAELKRLKRENAELRRANDMAGSGGGRNDLRVGL